MVKFPSIPLSRQALALAALIAVLLGGLLYAIITARKDGQSLAGRQHADETRHIEGAVLKTSMGDIEIAFLSTAAPATVRNFIDLAEGGFFDGTKFHRVIKNFMIQGGDPFSRGADRSLYGRGGPGYTFNDEISDEPMVKGVVAMANFGPNTNGSQFFILTRDKAEWLEGKHTIFAKVTKGMEVAEAIGKVETGKNDLPVVPVVLEKVVVK
jgi:cyclophilin family peptidyl-prolyl cis-trans isomerase